jgi:hypothetical protein
MFKNAKAIEAKAETKGKKKERRSILLSGVRKLAHLDAIIKAATSAKAVMESLVQDEVREEFEKEIERTGGMKPESFDAREGEAVINCQLRKRGANSALNEEERAIFETKGIKFKKEVITPQLFAINPEYAENEQMLGQVEKALAKLGLPADFIVMQEEKVKYVVDDETLDKALRSQDKDVIRLSTTLAFKPTLEKVVPGDLAKTMEEILGTAQEEEAPAPEAPAEVKEVKKPARKAAAKKA